MNVSCPVAADPNVVEALQSLRGDQIFAATEECSIEPQFGLKVICGECVWHLCGSAYVSHRNPVKAAFCEELLGCRQNAFFCQISSLPRDDFPYRCFTQVLDSSLFSHTSSLSFASDPADGLRNLRRKPATKELAH